MEKGVCVKLFAFAIFFLLLVCGLSHAADTIPPATTEHDSQSTISPDALRMGISLELFLPNDYPSFSQSMPLLGPVFVLPISQDALECYLSYGNAGNITLIATQLDYRLNVYTPFIPLYFLFGGDYLHYSAKELVGVNTGAGVDFEMAKGFFMGLNMKLFSFLNQKVSMSFGGGFSYSL